MVKTTNKVTASKTTNKKQLNKNRKKDNSNNNNNNNKNNNTTSIIAKTESETKLKAKSSKDKIDNSIRPLELPQPSVLLQLPLTGDDIQNLFWVLPYSTNSKLKISVHWPGIIVDIKDTVDKNIVVPKKPEIKDNYDKSFVLFQLFGIYKLAWIVSNSKYILPFDRYLVQRCARSRSKLFKKAVDQAIQYRKYKILPKEMIQKSHYLDVNNGISVNDDNNENNNSTALLSTISSPSSVSNNKLPESFLDISNSNSNIISNINTNINIPIHNNNSNNINNSINLLASTSLNNTPLTNSSFPVIKEENSHLLSDTSSKKLSCDNQNNNTTIHNTNPMYLLLEAVKSVNK